jgi:hypothetical protein
VLKIVVEDLILVSGTEELIVIYENNKKLKTAIK